MYRTLILGFELLLLLGKVSVFGSLFLSMSFYNVYYSFLCVVLDLYNNNWKDRL